MENQLDFYIEARLRAGRSEAQESVQPHIAISRLMKALHDQFQRHKHLPVAFPQYKSAEHEGDFRKLGLCVRVFGDEQTLSVIAQALKERTGAHFTVSAPKKVPAEVAGWIAFSRFNVIRRSKAKSMKKINGVLVPRENGYAVRAKQLEESNALPFFSMDSKSTQSTFSVIVVKHQVARDDTSRRVAFDLDVLDSYGLSRKHSPVWLPDFPLERKA